MSKPVKLTDLNEACHRGLKPSNEKFDFVGTDGKRVVFTKYTSSVIYNNKVDGNDNWGQLYYEPVQPVNSGMRGLQREPQKNKKGEIWYKYKLGGYFDITTPGGAADVEALQRLEKMDANGIAPYSGEMVMEDFNPESYKSKEFKPLLYFRKDPATNKPIAGTSPARYWPVSPYIDFKMLVPKLDKDGQQIMVQVAKLDEHGQPIVDAEGNPVMEQKAAVEAKPLSDYVPKKDPDTGKMRSEREIREIVFSMLEGVQFDYVPAVHHPAVTAKDGSARCDTSEEMVSAYLIAPPRKAEAVNQSQSVEHYAQQHNAEILAVQAEIEQLKARIAEQQVMMAQQSKPQTNFNSANAAASNTDSVQQGPGTNQPATDHKSDESFITQASMGQQVQAQIPVQPQAQAQQQYQVQQQAPAQPQVQQAPVQPQYQMPPQVQQAPPQQPSQQINFAQSQPQTPTSQPAFEPNNFNALPQTQQTQPQVQQFQPNVQL